MVSKSDLVEGLMRLRKAFPLGKQKGTLGIYAQVLRDLDPRDFKEALDRTIRKYEGIWPPLAIILRFAEEAGDARRERERAGAAGASPSPEEIAKNRSDPRVIDARAALRKMLKGLADGMKTGSA